MRKIQFKNGNNALLAERVLEPYLSERAYIFVATLKQTRDTINIYKRFILTVT